MSLKRIAERAGVSLATVSRVMNDHPSVAAETVESVRRVMKELSYTPRSHARRGLNGNDGSRGTSVAFFVFGTAGDTPAPAFERLLSGVSAAAAQHDLSLMFSFVSDPAHLPPRLAERKVDGLLLHGERPSRTVQARLRTLPTVWLMANRQRPE